MEVKLAYETDGGTTRRVLADNQGRVCERPAEGWRQPRGTVTTERKRYASWSDVPFAWVSGCPYWSASTVVH